MQAMTDVYPPPTHTVCDTPVRTSFTPPAFNPEQHLCFQSPKIIYTLESLKYSESEMSTAASRIGITAPFPLFTSSAVRHLRHELFQPQVLKEYAWYPNPETCQLRGMAPKFAKFMYDAWNHPRTLAAVSA